MNNQSQASAVSPTLRRRTWPRSLSVEELDLNSTRLSSLKRNTKQHNYIGRVNCSVNKLIPSLRKQPTFGDATTGFSAKWRLRNERRNSMLMTCHCPDLGSASGWLNQISHAARQIRCSTHIWVVTRHQYGIFRASFGGETSGGVAKCRLFSHAVSYRVLKLLFDYRKVKLEVNDTYLSTGIHVSNSQER